MTRYYNFFLFVENCWLGDKMSCSIHTRKPDSLSFLRVFGRLSYNRFESQFQSCLVTQNNRCFLAAHPIETHQIGFEPIEKTRWS